MLKGRIRRVMSLALIAAMLLVGMNVSPAVAAASYTGGAGAGTDSAPIYMPNDHTAVGIRYYAPPGSGLATSTAYYVKVRFTVGTTPSPDTNRGYSAVHGRHDTESRHEPWLHLESDHPAVGPRA